VASSGFPPDNPCVSLHPCFMANPSSCLSFDSYIYKLIFWIFSLHIFLYLLSIHHFHMQIISSVTKYSRSLLLLVMSEAKFRTWIRNYNQFEA
jgi:hypothetical protein